ncbi:MAG: K(+)-transporting ATPase subunit B [Proteobacteria bacterium]|jgi:K+-transporting ATPase ATPase B chain|nr:potassium-transporting ATPase subunit KdpB [Alphaproteobacteria bacterium]NCC03256.1 K(+)-transporting ATPase subunit B [Pseudomonadota bacterium]
MRSQDISQAFLIALKRLTPRQQIRNPVMFVVYVCAWLSLANLVLMQEAQDLSENPIMMALVSLILWVTVLCSNFAEAYAERLGKAQAASLRGARTHVKAKKLESRDAVQHIKTVSAGSLQRGDRVMVEAGDTIPADGIILEGIASVDESAITGESAPVIREAQSERNEVTGGTRLLSDWIIVEITADTGESFLDRMINMVEGAKRAKTPTEVALDLILISFTLIFLISSSTLLPFTTYSTTYSHGTQPMSLTFIIALFVCLTPTTIGGLLSAIGIAGIHRLMKVNVVATSGRAVEAAGDINRILIDKTGTITHGHRRAVALIPAKGVASMQLAQAAMMSSYADETPEGKSIVEFLRRRFGINPPKLQQGETAVLIPFSAETRLSGLTLGKTTYLKGSDDAIREHLDHSDIVFPNDILTQVELIARQGGTPLVVIQDAKVLGIIHLKDIIKRRIKERFAGLRRMGITSVMITGDNPLTAAAIAAEAGVDDFIAQASPEAKLAYIKKYQELGHLVAMVGDGTNDAPALAQADVALAMINGTDAAKEASNMIDLDSDPTKLIDIVIIGKQLLITRGALTAFSLATDIAKYFATIPAVFVSTVPALEKLNVMQLHSPVTAILSALIFNVLILLLSVPLAMKGIPYRPMSINALLRRNMIIYGGGGIFLPFLGIKLIDLVITFLAGDLT